MKTDEIKEGYRYSIKFNFNIRYRTECDPRVHTETVASREFEADKLSMVYAQAEALAKVLANRHGTSVYGKTYSSAYVVVEHPDERKDGDVDPFDTTPR